MPHIRFTDEDEGMDLEIPREEDPALTAMAVAAHPSFLPPSSSPSFPPSPSPSLSPSPSTFRPSDGAQALHAVKTIQTAYGPSDDPPYVFDLATNGDGSLLAASLSTHEIKIYTYASGDFLSTLHGHKGTITDLCFPDPGNPHMLASCASDGTVRLWDTRSNQQCLQWIAEGKEEFESLSFGGTSRNLLVAGANAKVMFWDTRSRKTVACLEDCHMEPVTQTRFHPCDPTKLVTASVDGLICVLDTSTTFDEDDCILGVLNLETSVSRVGYYGASAERLWALTNIETLSLWDLSNFSKICDFAEARQTAANSWDLGWVDYCVRCEYDPGSGLLSLIGGTQNGNAGVFPIQVVPPPPECPGMPGKGAFGRCSHVLSGGHMGIVRSVVSQGGVSAGGSSLFCSGFAAGGDSVVSHLVGWTGGEDSRLCAWSYAPVARANSAGGPISRKSSISPNHDQRTQPYRRCT